MYVTIKPRTPVVAHRDDRDPPTINLHRIQSPEIHWSFLYSREMWPLVVLQQMRVQPAHVGDRVRRHVGAVRYAVFGKCRSVFRKKIPGNMNSMRFALDTHIV
jgi:hypothetical protein